MRLAFLLLLLINIALWPFASGMLALGNDGAMVVSTNGMSWYLRPSGVYYDGANLPAATFAEGTWTVVGTCWGFYFSVVPAGKR